MGKYINYIKGKHIGKHFKQKCDSLLKAGAIEVTDEKFLPNMICVVDNLLFAAAGYAYDEREYKAFKHPCGRPKKWFILEGVEELVDD